MGVVSKKIQGADKSSFRIRHIEMAKKGEEDRLPGFSLCKREERFPLADEGKGPFNIFFLCLYAVAAARLGGARSLAFLLPLPATNEASQPRAGQTFSLSGSSPRGAGEWSPPTPINATPPGSELGETLGVRKGQLSGFRSNFHPPRGGDRGSGRGGEGCGAAGGGWGFLGRSLPPPYFRHLTPSAKRAAPRRG